MAVGEKLNMTREQVSGYTQMVMGKMTKAILEQTPVSGMFLTGGDTALGFFMEARSLGSSIVTEIAVGIPMMRLSGGLRRAEGGHQGGRLRQGGRHHLCTEKIEGGDPRVMARFGITMGDPCGIGPEIILKALKTRSDYLDRCLVFGSAALLEHYNEKFGHGFTIRTVSHAAEAADGCLNVVDPNPIALEDITVGKVCAAGGKCAFLYVKAAIDAALAKEITSVVTAPSTRRPSTWPGTTTPATRRFLASSPTATGSPCCCGATS